MDFTPFVILQCRFVRDVAKVSVGSVENFWNSFRISVARFFGRFSVIDLTRTRNIWKVCSMDHDLDDLFGNCCKNFVKNLPTISNATPLDFSRMRKISKISSYWRLISPENLQISLVYDRSGRCSRGKPCDDFYFNEILCPIDLALTFLRVDLLREIVSRDDFFLSCAKDFKDVISLENGQLLRRFVLRHYAIIFNQL